MSESILPTDKVKPILVIEDDVWARLIGIVLDPMTSQERWAAFADFMSPDLPDFSRWCDQVRKAAGLLFPSDVRLVGSTTELHDQLASADAIVTESLSIGAEELALARHLKVIHKYGVTVRNIDVAACEARRVRVLTVRRRGQHGLRRTCLRADARTCQANPRSERLDQY